MSLRSGAVVASMSTRSSTLGGWSVRKAGLREKAAILVVIGRISYTGNHAELVEASGI